MKLLVTGVAGMLGHKMFQVLRARFPGTLGTVIEDVTKPPFNKAEFLQGFDVIRGVDLADFSSLENILNDIKPDYIINCVGIIKQRDNALRPIPSITVNALLPHKLVEFADKWGGKVIHPSTDCVFSGKEGGYTEDHISDAQDIYGRTKSLGELQYENALTLRTSIIGRELSEYKSLLEWFLSQNGRTIRGFKQVIYSGVTTIELAEVVALIIEKFPRLNGLYQVVSKPLSKYDLLLLLKEAFNIPVEITPDESVISDRSMKGDKFRLATGYHCPPWPELAYRLANDPTPYDLWREASA